ncbi:MAG: FtsQ-type POTRA domain-containing protein [Firmicutes bacterium]|nr:FtsQ-type POTRA domain-containing protein [Bacillota bacterium]
MAKKIVKRRKIRLFRLLLVLLFLGGLFFACYSYLNTDIKNIIITGNNYLNDDYILELSNTKNYPSFYFTSSRSIKKKLLTSPYIEKVNVHKKFYHVLEINIKENKPIFVNNNKNTVVFENKKEVSSTSIVDVFRVPRVINYVPDDKYSTFIGKMSKIDDDTLGKISDIEYKPNDLDKDRFLLYMDDGNMVYLTLTKFKMINYYNDVLSQLENRKGILYLDNGNHFQIKE